MSAEHAAHPVKPTVMQGDRLLPYLEEERVWMAAQELPAVYVRNGPVCAAKRHVVDGGEIIGTVALSIGPRPPGCRQIAVPPVVGVHRNRIDRRVLPPGALPFLGLMGLVAAWNCGYPIGQLLLSGMPLSAYVVKVAVEKGSLLWWLLPHIKVHLHVCTHGSPFSTGCSGHRSIQAFTTFSRAFS